jgi:hypothetical protein
MPELGGELIDLVDGASSWLPLEAAIPGGSDGWPKHAEARFGSAGAMCGCLPFFCWGVPA